MLEILELEVMVLETMLDTQRIRKLLRSQSVLKHGSHEFERRSVDGASMTEPGGEFSCELWRNQTHDAAIPASKGDIPPCHLRFSAPSTLISESYNPERRSERDTAPRALDVTVAMELVFAVGARNLDESQRVPEEEARVE
jgi:hypothetical protein